MTLRLISQTLQPSDAARVSRETGGVLGGAWLGQPSGLSAPVWPVQRISAPVLGAGTAVVAETWLADQTLLSGQSEGIAWGRAGNLLYGVIELDEALFADAPASTPLQAASNEAYRRIFRLLEAQQLPHLWRV